MFDTARRVAEFQIVIVIMRVKLLMKTFGQTDLEATQNMITSKDLSCVYPNR